MIQRKSFVASALAALCSTAVLAQSAPMPPFPGVTLQPEDAQESAPAASTPPVLFAPAQAPAQRQANESKDAADTRQAKEEPPAAIIRLKGEAKQTVLSTASQPASASRAQAASPPDPAIDDRRLPALKGDEPSLKPFVLHTRVGINEVVRLSSSYLNRISTPFADPVLVDISNAAHKIVGSEVFFMPKDGEPVGIYIFDKANPSQTISMTVVPVRGIPGQNILVKIENFRALGQLSLTEQGQNPSAATADTPADHEGRLTQIMVGAIQGSIPGFHPVPLEAGVARLEDVSIIPDVVFQGYYLDVYRYELRNDGQRTIALNEGVFYRDGVKAVSFFPLDTVSAGQSTFVFIVSRKQVDPNPQTFLSEGDRRVRSTISK